MSDIDEQELLNLCKGFENELINIRQLKLLASLQEFQSRCLDQKKQELNHFREQQSLQYAAKKKQLQTNYGECLGKCQKNKQQISKQLHAYEVILEQLIECKRATSQQYNQKRLECQEVKDRVIGEWKKSSNETLKKLAYKEMLIQPQILKKLCRREKNEQNCETTIQKDGSK